MNHVRDIVHFPESTAATTTTAVNTVTYIEIQ